MPNYKTSSLLFTLFIAHFIVQEEVVAQTARVASTEEAEIMLDKHNQWRIDVHVSPLEWSVDLAKSAQLWTKELEKNCGFKHSNSPYGENLWKGTKNAFNIEDVVDSWGDEKQDYNYSKNKCKTGKVCGHYTQIVWAGTTEVGCATMICDNMTTWVCQYKPPGNWIGQKPY